MKILQAIEKWWREEIDLQQGSAVVVACSGGIDSLALLDILWRLKEKLKISVAAAHYEHGIRGQASRDDAAFVQRFCLEREIKCYLEAADVPKEAAEAGESLETAARRLRYAFLRRVTAELGGAYIATAHHKNDQAETVLMHLLRGSGIRGLCGMQARQGDVIRPVLFLSKAELSQYCQEQDLQPRHDATNDEADCTRNRLRLELLPLLEREYNPAVGEALCQLADLAAADEAYLQQCVDREWERLVEGHVDGFVTRIKSFLELPLALQRRLVQQMALRLSGQQLSFVHIESIINLISNARTGTQIQLPFGLRAKISYDFFYIEKKTIPFSENNGKMDNVGEFADIILKLPGVTVLPDGSTVEAEVVALPEGETLDTVLKKHLHPGSVYGDLGKCQLPIKIRHRQNGDVVHLGNGHKKLKDFLIDQRIPREKRDKLWLAVHGEEGQQEILWLAGVRRFATCLTDKTTKEIFILKMKGK